MDELDYIEKLRALATHPAARGLADDAAVLEVGSETLVLTHDMMVEGVHWLPGQDLADVAWKLVAANLSDLAAKGAEPVGALIGQTFVADGDRFLAGLAEALETFDVALLGGDTVARGNGTATIGLTAVGRATHTPVPSRSGAKPGDRVYLSGSIGAAMIGFEALRDGTNTDSEHFRRPRPRVDTGIALAPSVTAMMDVSDGLLLDAWRLAQASGVSLAIDGAAVPLAAPEGRRADALRWGDDYVLLSTAPSDASVPDGTTYIGEAIARGPTAVSLDGDWLEGPDGLGYRH